MAGIALLATACGSTSGETTDAQQAPASTEQTPAQSTTPESGSAEGVTIEVVATTDGGQLDWGTLEGQDVVLWFWAPW